MRDENDTWEYNTHTCNQAYRNGSSHGRAKERQFREIARWSALEAIDAERSKMSEGSSSQTQTQVSYFSLILVAERFVIR
jgi:hypothetical protein